MLALVLGAGDEVDGVAAGVVVAGATAADVAAEATGGADVGALVGDEPAAVEAEGVELDGVALGET